MRARSRRGREACGPSAVIPLESRLARTLDESIARRSRSSRIPGREVRGALPGACRPRPRGETGQGLGTKLAEAVARYYFKLMAYKDEYEVARLYTRPEFLQRVNATFDGDFKLKFHLAPPLLSKPDPVTGEAKKSSSGRGCSPRSRCSQS